MNIEEFLELADHVVFTETHEHLDDLQKTVLKGVWEGQRYSEIAEECYRTEAYVRNLASDLWKIFSDILHENINKSNIKSSLERSRFAHLSNHNFHHDAININNINICNNNPSPLSPIDKLKTASQKINWGNAPELNKMCDRTKELATLENWVIQEKCRLVSIIGLIGIGKTTLTRHLVEKLQQEFDTIIWRSFYTSPTLEITLKNLLICLSGQTCQELPNSLEEQLSMLMEYLRTKRCLMIFDGVQTLLNTGTFAGQYHPNYKNYSLLLKLIAETSHQSCLIINSWEIPQDIITLTDDHTPIRCLKLTGLSSCATEILLEKRLKDQEQWQKLIHTYQGNPLWLKIMTNMIQNIFRGKVAEFLQYENLHLGEELIEILKQHFQRLSSIEIRVIKTLSQAIQPLAIADLMKTSQLPATEVLQAIQSLERRCLIETEDQENTTCFTVTPIIKKYIMEIG